MRKLLGLAVVVMAITAGAKTFDKYGPESPKYIAFGWEFAYVTPHDYLKHVDQFKQLPFDGVGINIPGNGVRNDRRFREIMNAPAWTKDSLQEWVEPIRKMSEYACFKESFISSIRTPKERLGWEDDAAWNIASNNVRMSAWLAREGNMPGIQIDIEDYTRQKQFTRIDSDLPYAELTKIVRKRAQDMFRGVFEEYPNITVLCFWLLSDATHRMDETDLRSIAKEHGDLWWAFVNGMLDVLPPTACIVDGHEDAYKFEAEKSDYHKALTRIFNWDLQLVEKENRGKYLAQVEQSFGVYPDMYVNDPSSGWYFGPKNGSRLAHFAENLGQATSCTRRYVWFWSERGRWAKWDEEMLKDRNRIHGGAKLMWDEAIPGGCVEMVRAVKGQDEVMLPKLEKAIANGKLVNLVGKNQLVTWKAKPPKKVGGEAPGRLYREKGEMCAEGIVYEGCFAYEQPELHEGELYLVKAKIKGEHARLDVQFKNKNGRWMFRPRVQLPRTKDLGDGWSEIVGFVNVTDADCASMSISCGFAGMATGEVSRFKDFELYRVPLAMLWKK